MKKFIINLSLLLLAVGVFNTSYSQATTGCSTGGNINHTSNVNYTGVTGGDQVIGAAGELHIGPNGDYTIYGPVVNNGVITVASGGVLHIYGDMTNNAVLNVAPGGTINFYGQRWTNTATASVTDNAGAANATPGGAVNFIAARPEVAASWLTSMPCLSTISGGDALQEIDGGDVPMDIVLHVQNANNIVLVNTNTVIEGRVVFDIADGDVSLGDNNLVFTTNGNWELGAGLNPNDAFILTNGATACAGKVEKNGVAPGVSFVFPVGRAETYPGGRDFTPAIIQNDGSVTENFQISVKDYAEALAQGIVISVPSEGMDRVWQITSTYGSGVTISLQHNSATNGSDYTTVFGGDPNAFITQYQGGGTWSTALPPGAITGSVGGSIIHTQGFSLTSTATNCTEAGSWFTKTPDQVSPLPIELLSFDGEADNCDVHLTWTTANEINFSHFEIMYANDGRNFNVVGRANGGQNNYQFSYAQASGTGFYKLKLVDRDGAAKYSNEIKVRTDCQSRGIEVYPNPAFDHVNVKGVREGATIMLVNVIGQIITTTKAASAIEVIRMGHLAAGNYIIVVQDGTDRQVFKLAKKD